MLRLMERTDRISAHPSDPLPLACPRHVHRRRRRQAVRLPGSARRDRRASASAAASTPRSSSAHVPGTSPDRASGHVPRPASISCSPSHERPRARRGSCLVAGPAAPDLERRACGAPRMRSTQPLTALTSAGIPNSRITIGPTSSDDDPATALAAAADAATAEHLLLMQAPAMGLTHDWLTRLIGYSHQPEHRRRRTGRPRTRRTHPTRRHRDPGRHPPLPPVRLPRRRRALAVVYNLSAVSGVLATRRDTYQAARRPRPRSSKSSRSSTTACAPPTPASAS